MPIELPNLDDKSYADLVAEAQASIPGIYPAWTDHNPSDPGITLIELFAWLSEMLLYRTNRISDSTVRTFLKILNGKGHEPPADQDLESAISATMVGLRERWRAVTLEDYEELTKTRWAGSPAAAKVPEALRIIHRVRALSPSPEKVMLVVVPEVGFGTSPWLGPTPDLLSALDEFFDERRLITTRFYVTGPSYVEVGVSAVVYLNDDARATDVRAAASAALARRLHPIHGGVSGEGWPFGRNIHVSELSAMLDGIRGVSYVEGATLVLEGEEDPAPRSILEDNALVGVRLEPQELPKIGTITLTMKERRGGTWMTIDP